jgi:tRNA A37 threonylcarbamoyladenosine dehydratase
VVDAIDSLNPKCRLMEELFKRNISFISSMGAALKTKPESIKFQRLKKTKNCPLARFVRKRLSRRGVDISDIMCVASDELCNFPRTALYKEDENAKRHAMGSLPTITAIFGLIIANQIILAMANSKKIL